MKHTLATFAVALAALSVSAAEQVLFRGGDAVGGVVSKVYRIPAMCTAPNGDLVAVCDARRNHMGDLNSCQPIEIAVRRSSDGGRTWSAPVFSTDWWKWNEREQWAASDPSLVVDSVTKKIFLFVNVWECRNKRGVYQHFVQESSDNGKTWSRPRDITSDISVPEWRNDAKGGGFIFITSGSGIQTKDGTLLHTLVRVRDGNALFGSTDHGKTWRAIGRPVKIGDECKVVELTDGSWMINSRWHDKGKDAKNRGGREIHVTKDRGETWTSRYDAALADSECNAQIMRVGNVLLFSNCNDPRRRARLYVRVSRDDGATWNEGVCVQPGGAAYSDMAVLKDGKTLGVIYEGAGYDTINFVTIPLSEVLK